MLKIHPLIQQLSKLRESSKEAVADANIVLDDELKRFLHIRRPVEQELEEQILDAYNQDGPALIMVCGNVGDGKSHLLSKLRESKKLTEALPSFNIYNDATESFSPTQTSNDALKRKLADFSDQRLGEGKPRIILAINLGTLNNFLEAHGAEFSHMDGYVKRKGIIDEDTSIDHHEVPQDSYFRYVNFTNRHFFNLGPNGALASPITTLLAKVVSAEKNNPIYQGYLQAKEESWAPYDPVLHNYELLFKSTYREVVAQLIVTCIVMDKQIISFRQLLNFIYDIIVPYQLSEIDGPDYGHEIAKKDIGQRLAFSLPYYIFENPNLSRIFHSLNLHDPAVRRYEQMDERIILLFTEVDPFNWLSGEYKNLFPRRSGFEAQAALDYKVISKAYLRYEFFERSQDERYNNDYFREYLKYLYAFNNCDRQGLRGIVDLVKSATYAWNGGTIEKKVIIVPTAVKNSSYRIFKDLVIQGRLPKEAEFRVMDEITEFRQEIMLKFSTADNHPTEPFDLAIDYALFVLLKNVSLGYRPNKIDRYTYIGFDRFVEQLTFSAIELKTLYVDQINFGKPLDYQFEFDEENEEFTFLKK